MRSNGYLGLDLGGTGAKAGVFDHSGNLLGLGHRTYTPKKTKQGYAEISIQEIYAAAREATIEVIEKSGAQILALSISSQGQTFVSLDEKDQPLHKAIIWYDGRASEQATQLNQTLHGMNSPDPLPEVNAIATAPKILWMRQHHPVVMSRAKRYLLLPDYFAYRLTGQAVIDPDTASSTGLYAYDTPDYNTTVLEIAEINEEQVARIQPAGTPIGKVRPPVAKEWGLDTKTLLVTGCNDQYAGALGAGNYRPGILSETTGTCLALVTLTEKLPDPLPQGLSGGRFPIPQYQFVLAYSKTAGLLLDWFRHEFCPQQSLEDLDEMAAQVSIGSRGVTVLPHFEGMVSPVPNANARGAFCNLTLSHTHADIYHAILESLSFCLRENIEFLRENGFQPEVIRSIGGGAKSDLWLQMKANVTGLSVEKPVVTEAAVLGAAMLAAVGDGKFSSLAECSKAFFQIDRIFAPTSANHRIYQGFYEQYLELCAKMYDTKESQEQT